MRRQEDRQRLSLIDLIRTSELLGPHFQTHQWPTPHVRSLQLDFLRGASNGFDLRIDLKSARASAPIPSE